MGKSQYSIQKRVENNKEFYDLVLHEEILFTSENYTEVLNLIKSQSGVDLSDHEVSQRLEYSNSESKIIKQIELERQYERPGTAIDTFIILLMVFSIVGLFFLASELRLTDLNLVIAIGVLIVQIMLMGTILTSRKIDRALLNRLDEVEKKLNMYKTLDDNVQENESSLDDQSGRKDTQ